ncbi:MAG: YbaB/EbfC family nucleoid-associated protein [Bacillota bacterium]
MVDINKMMKQVQKLQTDMAKLQEDLAGRTVEATAGGGMVRAVANGRQELVTLEIKPEAVDPEDVEMLQDMVLAAVNESLRQSRDMVAKEMGRLTGGLGIPPGLL